jgi:hypothetical protein
MHRANLCSCHSWRHKFCHLNIKPANPTKIATQPPLSQAMSPSPWGSQNVFLCVKVNFRGKLDVSLSAQLFSQALQVFMGRFTAIWVKRIAFCNMGGPHPAKSKARRKQKSTFLQNQRKSLQYDLLYVEQMTFLTSLSGLRHWLSWNWTCQLKIVGLFSLHNHVTPHL